MKHFKLLAMLLLSAVLFVVTGKILGFILNDDTERYTRIMMHEFYKDDMDTVFVGSSHCFDAIDPYVADESDNIERSFVAGSSGQRLDESYCLVKESKRVKNDIKQVFVELYYGVQGADDGEITNIYIITDYMKPSPVKFSYLFSVCNKSTCFNILSPARRNWKRLGDPIGVAETVKNKMSKKYMQYAYVNDYSGRGHISVKNSVSEPYIKFEDFYKENPGELEFTEKYIRLLSDFCKDNNMNLYLFSAPISDFQLVSYGKYDDYVRKVKEIADRAGCRYFDFNLLNRKYGVFEQKDFHDEGHLNQEGSKKFTKILSAVVEDPEKNWFYDSYSDKLRDAKDQYFGSVVEFSDYEISIFPAVNFKTEHDLKIKVWKSKNNDWEYIGASDENGRLEYDGSDDGKWKFEVFIDDEKAAETVAVR